MIEGLKKKRTEDGGEFPSRSLIFMKGHIQHAINHDDDATCNWKPEPNFLYLFGFPDVFDLYGLIDPNSGDVIVSLPKQSEQEKIFDSGLTVDSNPADYGIDRFITHDQLEVFVAERHPEEIFIYDGRTRYEVKCHQPTFDWLSNYQ